MRVRLSGARSIAYEIKIGAGALDLLGDEARRLLPNARRLALISNRRVLDHYGERATESLRARDYSIEPLLIGDGERHKSLRTLERVLAGFHRAGIERSDAVVALGGGVVGDLAGFAAAVYLRGIPFIQVPTTLLAQIDASVGGKTAVNTPAAKNSIGAFHQPRAVLIDTATLCTLPRRELTAGWCEAIKQGAVGSRELFEQTCDFLRGDNVRGDESRNVREDERDAENGFQAKLDQPWAQAELDRLIAAQCAFKASIVAGDERENPDRTDSSSRRILNFGHTTAHALESITGYRRFRHGEAVGHGMLVAGEISKRLGLLDPSELEYLREAVRLAGRLPSAADLNPADIIRALAHDKKSVGGRIKWVLLKELGRATLLDGQEIPRTLLRASLRAALQTQTVQ